MGNTVSKGNEIYFFLDPLEESRKRRDLFLKTQEKAREKSKERNHILYLFQKNLLPELKEAAEQWRNREYVPIPEILSKELSPALARQPSQAEAPGPTILTCYEVIPGHEKDIWVPLVLLTRPGRVPKSVDIMPVDPRLIFHLRGDLGNPKSNGMLSTLFDTKHPWRSIRDVGATEKSFVHIFEPDDQEPDFATALEELVQAGALHRSIMRFDNNTTESLRILALLWARANCQGIDPVGGDEITKGLEEVELELYERITRPRQSTVEWFGRYGNALVMLLSFLRLRHYLK